MRFAKEKDVRCPKCGKFKVYNEGKVLVFSGIMFVFLSLILMASVVFALVGVIFFVCGLGLIINGTTPINKNKLFCFNCGHSWSRDW